MSCLLPFHWRLAMHNFWLTHFSLALCYNAELICINLVYPLLNQFIYVLIECRIKSSLQNMTRRMHCRLSEKHLHQFFLGLIQIKPIYFNLYYHCMSIIHIAIVDEEQNFKSETLQDKSICKR